MDAAAVTAVVSAYDAAYTLAVDPSTRTPSTVAAKDAAKSAALATVRPIAQFIRNNLGVSNEDKIALGLTVPSTTPTPIPTPTTVPLLSVIAATPGVHKISMRDDATPLSKAKPFGALQLQLFSVIGTVVAPTPAGALFVSVVTKSPFFVDLDPADAGKIATYFGRWVTRTGKVGPWSSGASLTVAF
jgi:hypothetical protein